MPRRKVKDDPSPPTIDLPWEERLAVWKARERDLLLERNAAREQADAEAERADRAEAELAAIRPKLDRALRRIAELESAARKAASDAKDSDAKSPAPPPAFVKPNVAAKAPRKTPGRKKGHAAALRPMPSTIHQSIDVPLPRDAAGRELCPCCNTPLSDLRDHDRIVEDVRPPELDVTRFRTRSGRCIRCDRTVESRAPHQPPAPPIDLPHGQVGLNALAMGVMLRVRHRLPFRQITTILDRLAGLRVSPGALVRQMKRVATWLEGEHEKLVLRMRASKVIHADETGWRIDGKNGWAWVFTQPLLTLFVLDPSRGGKVARDALGAAFSGTLVTDFYSAYDALDCPKQRCLTHLLRELKTEGEKDAAFANDPWVVKLKRWCQDAIGHKKKWKTLADERYEVGASRLEDRLDELIKVEPAHAEARRIHKRIKKHRPDLTRFLWDEGVEATNNPAERALRPLVVARKISGGSRSTEAAEAWAKLSGLLATQEQNGKNVLVETKKLLVDYWASEGR